MSTNPIVLALRGLKAPSLATLQQNAGPTQGKKGALFPGPPPTVNFCQSCNTFNFFALYFPHL